MNPDHQNQPTVTAPAEPPRRRALKSMLAWAAASAAGAGLAGCGGGASSSTDPSGAGEGRKDGLGGVDSGGTGSPRSFFRARLQAVAPLTAAGVAFDTQACSFVDGDGRPTAAATLAPGMTVAIEASTVRYGGSQPSARAITLRTLDQLEGALSAVDTAASTLTLAGQTVAVTASTVLDPALAADWTAWPPGTRLRVWGDLDTGLSRVVASRIDAAVHDDHDLVRGAVTALDRMAGTLAIGPLALQTDPALAAAWPAGLAVGQVVRATLLPLPGTPPGSEPAALLSLSPDATVLPDQVEVELEGRVTALRSATDFDVDGVPVDAAAATQVSGLGALAVGAQASVHGRSQAGILVADQVEIQAGEDGESDTGEIEMEGRLQQLDLAGQTFVLQRQRVHWSDETVFKGGTVATLRPRARVAVRASRGAGGEGALEAVSIHIEA